MQNGGVKESILTKLISSGIARKYSLKYVSSSLRCSVIWPLTFSPAEVHFPSGNREEYRNIRYNSLQTPFPGHELLYERFNSILDVENCCVPAVKGTDLNNLFLRQCLPHEPKSRATQDIACSLLFEKNGRKKNKNFIFMLKQRKVLSCESYLTSVRVDKHVCTLPFSSRSAPKCFTYIRMSYLEELTMQMQLPTPTSIT
jgi:hypothetical protein